MKKSMIISLVLCFVILSGCTQNPRGRESIRLDEKQSFFDEFTVDGEKVYLYCCLTIHNPNGEEYVQIHADFSEDVKGGLLKNGILTACDPDDTSRGIFKLKPGINDINVVFIGEYATNSQKQNRLLPPIEIVSCSAASGAGDRGTET